jgi:hypothetical protein
MNVQAKGNAGQLSGFVVNETLMIVADMAPDDRFTFKAYCSDSMSERGYPFSIHLIVDGRMLRECLKSSCRAEGVGAKC